MCSKIPSCCLFKHTLHSTCSTRGQKSLFHAHGCIRKMTVCAPSNWHNMLQMTYAVCHLLASKDRCERPCLSPSDWWLVSLPSVSTPSESLVLSAVVHSRKRDREGCNVQAHAVTCRDLTGEILPFPHLTPLSCTLSARFISLLGYCTREPRFWLESSEWGEFGWGHRGSVCSLCCQKCFMVAWTKLDST